MKNIGVHNIWCFMMIVVCAGWMSACSVEDNYNYNENAVVPISELGYSERVVPVVNTKNDPQGAITLRFYDDMPSVAYVDVSTFQNLMYPGTSVQVNKTGNEKFVLTNPFGTATVDVSSDTFESDDYEAFTNLMGQIQEGSPNILYDAMPFIRWKSLEKTPQQVPVTFDYGKYGIDLRADDKGVYFPFATIADLYMDSYMHSANFNGQSVMISPEGATVLDGGSPEFFIAPLIKETRTADMSQFSYNNLCFTLTNFFGYPGRTLLENKGLKEKGLDKALQDYGKAGGMTRELLKSQNMYDFISGTTTLECLMYDAGHTHTSLNVFNPFSEVDPAFAKKLESRENEILEEFFDCCPEYVPVARVTVDKINMANTLTDLRADKFGSDVYYVKEGNTVYCLFNDFFTDVVKWRKYYNGEGPKPSVEDSPDDWFVILTDALNKAQADPEVKNFIIDVSTNLGGSTDVAVFITSVLCNKSEFSYDNVLTGQRMKCTFDVDRNLDGQFDEKDKDVKYDLNIGLLISPFSFSCSNLLPSQMKDYGFAILGQKSGGGSCCVVYSPSADGFCYIYSSNRIRMVNEQGENIDSGVTPHYELTTDEYFDIPKLGGLIENFYSK